VRSRKERPDGGTIGSNSIQHSSIKPSKSQDLLGFVYLSAYFYDMMLTTADEIGNILREARELKGATLNDVHQNLRISVKFLKALEAGEYHHLPSTTHVRGYLGKYARFLGLEPTPLLERYESIKDMLPQPGGNTAAYPPLPNYTQTQPHLPEPETGTFFEANPVEVGPVAANSGGRLDRAAHCVGAHH
jgi:transcriptional regulator with XRE-family HTH domain